MEHWLISIRCENSESQGLWESLRKDALNPTVCSSFVFSVEQQFKSGSLDSLVALADDLNKLDHQLEGVLRKVERQYVDIEPNPQLLIEVNNRGAREYISPSAYLADFHWDISKYPPSKTLSELSSIIEERLRGLDDDLKAKTSKFVELRNALSQLNKKESGGLLNKDLSEVLTHENCSREDFINTDYLKTFLVIVPKKDIEVWINSYESLTNRVIPRSTKQFDYNDKDNYTLWRVVILKVGQEEFLNAAKKAKIAVREFEYNPDQRILDKQNSKKLRDDFDNQQLQLSGHCKSVFGELFISLIHLKAMRIYTESILRYSLPPQFFSFIVTPKEGKEKKILDSLIKKFIKPGEKSDLYCSKEESEEGEDFFPFAFLRIPKY
jgi:V-type H+-transporting ATPase subunit C